MVYGVQGGFRGVWRKKWGNRGRLLCVNAALAVGLEVEDRAADVGFFSLAFLAFAVAGRVIRSMIMQDVEMCWLTNTRSERRGF